jgi:hypothetical protein
MNTKFCGYDIHPAANLFPMMTDDEFDELLDDIREHGQILPIILHDGKILDGRNRAMACHRLGKTPKTEILVCDDPISWAISANAKRRNLTKAQLAAVAADSLPLYEAEASIRKKATEGRPKKLVEKVPQVFGESDIQRKDRICPECRDEFYGRPEDHQCKPEPKARDKAAKAAGVNARYVQDAKKIKEESPETFEKLKSGETTLQQAKKDLYGGRAHEGSNVVKPREEAPEDHASDTLWTLNYHWKRATKKEKAGFCKEHGLKQTNQ